MGMAVWGMPLRPPFGGRIGSAPKDLLSSYSWLDGSTQKKKKKMTRGTSGAFFVGLMGLGLVCVPFFSGTFRGYKKQKAKSKKQKAKSKKQKAKSKKQKAKSKKEKSKKQKGKRKIKRKERKWGRSGRSSRWCRRRWRVWSHS
jgi:hypothetical protein